MIVGRWPSDHFGASELIDLSGQSLDCPEIAAFPVDYGSVGTFIDNKALVCGGISAVEKSDCYSYDMQVN